MRTFIDKLHTLDIGSEIEMDPFFVKIETLLKTIKEDMVASFQDKQNTFTSIASHQKNNSNYYESFYITSKERIDTLINVLLFLKTAAQNILIDKNEINNKNILTESSFNSLPMKYTDLVKNIHFLGNLLIEEDVRLIAIENYQITYPNSRPEDINKYVDEHYNQFLKLAPPPKNFNIKKYKNLLEALKHLSMFWFKVKDGDRENIRKSDIYIYQLCRVFI